MPLDFKKMIEFVLEKKPETTLEQLKELIEEKKRRIGAGYLTDQGALFLVASIWVYHLRIHPSHKSE